MVNQRQPRPDKTEYYLNLAHSVARRGTCLRRNFGAVIINNDEVISTGYVGAPRGRQNCIDVGECTRQKLNIPAGERYELCRSVHAEANAIISASRKDMMGGQMYLVGVDAMTGDVVESVTCCAMCKRMIINAGITAVIVMDPAVDGGFNTFNVRDWVFIDESLAAHNGY